jgi:DNA-binding CsgD family transcriptional regulator
MTDIPLTGSELTGIRRLLSIDEAAEDRQRWRALTFLVTAVIPCDQIGVGVTDATGCLEYAVDVPDDGDGLDPQVCDGTLPVGIQHLATFPHDDEDVLALRQWGLRDTLRIGFALGQGRVVQMYLDRRSRLFEGRDVALLTMLEPFLARVMRPNPRAVALQVLSDSEHRVLAMVAAGGTNNDVAAQLMVSEATVRKHLEHTYRKLGVANRTAAAALVRQGAGT